MYMSLQLACLADFFSFCFSLLSASASAYLLIASILRFAFGNKNSYNDDVLFVGPLVGNGHRLSLALLLLGT